jgi:hypothetical protein
MPNVDPVHRVALQICKALQSSAPLSVTEVQGLIAGSAAGPDTSVRWRSRRPREGDFDKALALALSSGWLCEQDGAFSLTPEGARIGRRSRVGHHKIWLGKPFQF